MILIDKDIKKLVNENELIIENFQEENLNCISYDLTISEIIDHGTEYKLKPGEFVIIKTNEKISIPLDIVGKIAEKNSLLRLGLTVDGPYYHPGHITYCYLRVYNMSKNTIILKKDFKIAQIIFEKLHDIPDVTYDKKKDASFQNEETYKKYGNYEEKYASITNK